MMLSRIFKDPRSSALRRRSNNAEDYSFLWGTANALSVVTSLLAVLLLAVFPLAIHLSPLEQVETTLDRTWRPNCEGVHVPDEHKSNFAKAAIASQMINVRLSIPNMNMTPMSWVWISSMTRKINNYMTWHENYALLKLGILDLLTNDLDIEIKIPPKCASDLGEQSTVDLIAVTLDNLTRSISQPSQKYSRWCHSKRVHSRLQFIQWLKANFLYLIQNAKDYCCIYKDKEGSCREYEVLQDDMSSVIIPFYLSFLVGIFSPLLFIYLVHSMRIKSVVPWMYWGESIDDYLNPSDYPDTVFLGFRSPITFLSILADGIEYPFNRILKFTPMWRDWHCFILLLMSPFAIYIKLFINYYNPRFLNLLKLAQVSDIDIGFSSMLFVCERKSMVLFCIFGGPSVFFFLFYVLGTLLILFNIWLKFDYADIALVKSNHFDPQFDLHLDLFKSNTANVQYRIFNIIAENSVKKAFARAFWNKVLLRDMQNTNRFLGSLTFVRSVLFHHLPIVFTSHLISTSSMLAIIAKSMQRLPQTRFPKLMSVFAIGACVVVGICQLILLFISLTIITASVQFIYIVSVSSIVTFVIFPSEAEDYVLFITATGLCIAKDMRGVSRIYHRLLCRSVQACREFRIGQTTDHRLLTYSNGHVGIPILLYEQIVDRYEPKFLKFVKVIVKIGVTCFGLNLTFGMMREIHGGRAIVHQTIRAVTVFFVVKASEMYSLMMWDYDEITVDPIYIVYITKVIRQYLEERRVVEDES